MRWFGMLRAMCSPFPELDGFVSVASAINDAGEIAGAITIPGRRAGGSLAAEPRW